MPFQEDDTNTDALVDVPATTSYHYIDNIQCHIHNNNINNNDNNNNNNNNSNKCNISNNINDNEVDKSRNDILDNRDNIKNQNHRGQPSAHSLDMFPVPVSHVTRISKKTILRNANNVCPVEFKWYENDKSYPNHSNNPEDPTKRRRRYVQISHIFQDLFSTEDDHSKTTTTTTTTTTTAFFLHKDKSPESMKNEFHIEVGQIILWMNNQHICSPQQAQEILIQVLNDDHHSFVTMVTYEPDDIMLRLVKFPFLKLCAMPFVENGCQFSHVRTNHEADNNKKNNGSFQLLYVSDIHPICQGINNPLRCGDIILAINGYTVDTIVAASIAMKYVRDHKPPIVQFYVIDFVQFQYYVYERCIETISGRYPYDVKFIDENDHYDKNKNNTNNRYSGPSCQLAFYEKATTMHEMELPREEQSLKEYDSTTKTIQDVQAISNRKTIAYAMLDVAIFDHSLRDRGTIVSMKETVILVPMKSVLSLMSSKHVTYRKVIIPFVTHFYKTFSSVLCHIENSVRTQVPPRPHSTKGETDTRENYDPSDPIDFASDGINCCCDDKVDCVLI